MPIEQCIDKKIFISSLQSLFLKLEENTILQPIRKKAWESFCTKISSISQSESFRNFPLKKLYTINNIPEVNNPNIKECIYSKCKESVLVFVDGQYCEMLSNIKNIPKQIVISSLDTTMKTLKHRWILDLNKEQDPFVLLNAAMQKGIFIYIPPKTHINSPIQILNIVHKAKYSFPHARIFVGSQSAIDIYYNSSHIEYPCLIDNVIDLTIDNSANVSLKHIINEKVLNGWHLDNIRVRLKKDVSLKLHSFVNGGFVSRRDLKIDFEGENSNANIEGGWMLDNNKHIYTNVLVNHQEPNCKSYQLFKGVLNNNSHSVFNGKVKIYPQAQKTDAYQLNNNLLLSDNAFASSMPTLEIFADDVKASHGSTVCQLDEELLFYLRSRGITKLQAQNLLTKGFMKAILDNIPHQE